MQNERIRCIHSSQFFGYSNYLFECSFNMPWALYIAFGHQSQSMSLMNTDHKWILNRNIPLICVSYCEQQFQCSYLKWQYCDWFTHKNVIVQNMVSMNMHSKSFTIQSLLYWMRIWNEWDTRCKRDGKTIVKSFSLYSNKTEMIFDWKI